MKCDFTLNGERVSVEAEEIVPLVRVLREFLGLVETREGRGQGGCGACLVFLDGDLVNSCLIPLFRVAGCNVETIEGIREKRAFQELERAIAERHAFECGFCSSGMLMAAYSLLLHARSPSEEAVRDALSGNHCSCGSFPAILDGVLSVVDTRSRRLGRRR